MGDDFPENSRRYQEMKDRLDALKHYAMTRRDFVSVRDNIFERPSTRTAESKNDGTGPSESKPYKQPENSKK